MHSFRPVLACLSLMLMLMLMLMLLACGDRRTESPVEPVGQVSRPGTRLLETGAALLQDKAPVEALNAYLDGFHFYNGRPDAQMEAHHYCAILSEELIQCVIYDGNVKDAKLMGVEYIVSARLFAQLPDDEKTLWHSHANEVKSGQLIAPGIPELAEHQLMERLVNTYGKTWHTWHTDQGKNLPLGVPQLMMGFTADRHPDAKMVADRDHRFSVDSSRKRNARASIPSPPLDSNADAWRRGRVYQIPDFGNTHGPHRAKPSGG